MPSCPRAGCPRQATDCPRRAARTSGRASPRPSAARRTARRASPTRTRSRRARWSGAAWWLRSRTAMVTAATSAAPGARGWPRPGEAEDDLRRVLVPGIVSRWRDAVRADVAAEPFTGAENAVRRGDDATVPYGTTLLLAIGQGERLLLAQIGDGDIVGIAPDGTALPPVPGDPLLDGRHTTSLCSPGAGDSFRVAAVDLTGTPLLGALLATDGYGNAQVAQTWEAGVSADLAGLITTHPPSRLAGQLPEWAGQCASLDGSADDTTLALLLAPAAAAVPGPGVTAP